MTLLVDSRFWHPSRTLELAKYFETSALTSANTLGGTFKVSRGFAFSFTQAGMPELSRRFGLLERFVVTLRRSMPERRMQAWHKRLTTSAKNFEPNAFYLNFLYLDSNMEIAPHVDATLCDQVGDMDLRPQVVSVLYVGIDPAMRGGELCIHEPQRQVVVKPRSNLCVHFSGDLTHEIHRIQNDRPIARLSLVLEQYRLPTSALERLKPFRLHTRNAFQALLKKEFRSGFDGPAQVG